MVGREEGAGQEGRMGSAGGCAQHSAAQRMGRAVGASASVSAVQHRRGLWEVWGALLMGDVLGLCWGCARGVLGAGLAQR